MPHILASSNSYPLLSAFWTIFEVFLWVIWIWILITVFIDIFRSHDLSGGAKALWFVFVLFIPLVGVLAYLIVRGGSMHERSVHAYRYDWTGGRADSPGNGQQSSATSTADQLAKLADLHDRGALTDEEYDRAKARLLTPTP
ncbi:MAG TPA: SHOCT domain-containing protein [Streptosporangiaceae bacterium]|nr:SHOCT domain-containing protein [Streptosporangiaceae bacterium]